MNFREFIKSEFINAWIYDTEISLYVRKNNSYPGFIDLANLNADNPGKGSLTKFLNEYEHKYKFRVENVLNARLVKYLFKRGYIIVAGHIDCPVMIKK